MNEWLDFLKQQGAHIENNEVVHFGNKAEELRSAVSSTVLCELTHMGLIAVQGEDALDFLQNQLSNDVKQVNGQSSQLNAYCTAKGRALSTFRVLLHNNTYYLYLPAERIEATLKRLQMFVLRSRVTLEDSSGKMISLGVAGNDAAKLLQPFVTELPDEDNHCTANSSTLVIKIAGPVPRYLVCTELDNARKIWEQLRQHATPCGHAVWSWFDIRAGIPQVYEENVEAFVPQMMNLHSIDGISFQKGCYPGQEVVARMYYLGKLKRRMYLAKINQDEIPRRGALLFTENDSSEQGVGRIVDAQSAPDGGIDILAVLQVSSVDNATIHLGKPDGPQLEFQELPYNVELERQK